MMSWMKALHSIVKRVKAQNSMLLDSKRRIIFTIEYGNHSGTMSAETLDVLYNNFTNRTRR